MVILQDELKPRGREGDAMTPKQILGFYCKSIAIPNTTFSADDYADGIERQLREAGYKIVSVEPTELLELADKGIKDAGSFCDAEVAQYWYGFKDGIKAMLKAAP